MQLGSSQHLSVAFLFGSSSICSAVSLSWLAKGSAILIGSTPVFMKFTRVLDAKRFPFELHLARCCRWGPGLMYGMQTSRANNRQYSGGYSGGSGAGGGQGGGGPPPAAAGPPPAAGGQAGDGQAFSQEQQWHW